MRYGRNSVHKFDSGKDKVFACLDINVRLINRRKKNLAAILCAQKNTIDYASALFGTIKPIEVGGSLNE